MTYNLVCQVTPVPHCSAMPAGTLLCACRKGCASCPVLKHSPSLRQAAACVQVVKFQTAQDQLRQQQRPDRIYSRGCITLMIAQVARYVLSSGLAARLKYGPGSGLLLRIRCCVGQADREDCRAILISDAYLTLLMLLVLKACVAVQAQASKWSGNDTTSANMQYCPA